MTLIELCRFLRSKWKRIIVISLVCAVAVGCGVKVMSVAKPSFTATSTVVATGGTFSAASGLSQVVATEASSTKATVTSTSNTTNNTVTFKSEGSSSIEVVNAVNQAAQQLSDTAMSQEVVKNTSITKATSAHSTYKSSLFCFAVAFFVCVFLIVSYYIMRDSARGGIHSPEAVSRTGLTYLGCLDGNDVSTRFSIANFHFTNKNKGELSQRVLLQPTSFKVNIKLVESILGDPAKEAGIILRVAPALRDSVYTLYKAESANTVIVVVEENVSTLSEVEEIVREFKIANVHCGGFIYLPQFNKQIKSSKKRSVSGSHGIHTN